jgi:hypothetical protein
MNVTELRLGLLARGFDPLPITNPDALGKDAGKAPRLPKWQTIDITPDAIRGWERTRRRETNTGLRCGYTLGLDVDVRDVTLVNTLVALASDTIGETPLMRIGRAPKTLLAYRTTAAFAKIKTPRLLMPDGQHALIECLATGQQFVAFGIHPETRQPYHWPNATPLEVSLSELPAVTEAQARAFVAEAECLLRGAGGRPEQKDAPTADASRSRAPRPASGWPPPTRQDVSDALKAVPNTVDWHWLGEDRRRAVRRTCRRRRGSVGPVVGAVVKRRSRIHPPQMAQPPNVADDHHRCIAVLVGTAEWLAPGRGAGRSESTPKGNRPLNIPTVAPRRGQHRASGCPARAEPSSS